MGSSFIRGSEKGGGKCEVNRKVESKLFDGKLSKPKSKKKIHLTSMQPLYRYISWVMNIFGYHAMIKLLLIFCQKGGGGGQKHSLGLPHFGKWNGGTSHPRVLCPWFLISFWFHMFLKVILESVLKNNRRLVAD